MPGRPRRAQTERHAIRYFPGQDHHRPGYAAFGKLTLFVENFAQTDLDGSEAGRTLVTVTPGLRFNFGKCIASKMGLQRGHVRYGHPGVRVSPVGRYVSFHVCQVSSELVLSQRWMSLGGRRPPPSPRITVALLGDDVVAGPHAGQGVLPFRIEHARGVSWANR